MEQWLSAVLSMSGTASLVIAAVLLIRLALRRAPKRFSYLLWAVVLFRLLCPVSLESAFSLLPAAELVPAAGNGGQERQVVQVQTGLPGLDRQMNDFFLRHPYQGIADHPERAGATPSPVIPQAGKVSDWRTLPAILWLTGAALLLGYSALSLIRLRRALAEAVPLEGEPGVWLADRVPTPFVLGLLRPRIYLPSALPKQERDYILLHERTHIRRCDHILRALAWLAVAVHWFNPLVWLAFRLAGKDMEMSCDEAVLRNMDRDVRADYSASLLRLSAGGREKLPAGPLAFGDSDPKSRIKNVLNYKKPALWVMAAAVVVVAITCAALATNRVSQPAGEKDTPPVEVWVDYFSDPGDLPWDEYRDLQLPEFPEKTFRWNPGLVEVVETNYDLVTHGTLYSGMPVWNVFLCDLNGDGKREFCSTVSFGSGLVDNHVEVYDYANQHRYLLWDRGIYDYTLSLEDGQLMVTKSEYIGEDIASGRLILTEDGRLAIEGQEVNSTAAPEIDLSPAAYALDDLWTYVDITGLDCEYIRWYARELNTHSEIPENALGYLEISEPRFLGLSEDYYYVTAVYSPQEDPDRIWLQLGPRAQGGSSEIHCVVDLTTGQQSPIYGEPYAELDPQELLSAARALAQLIVNASDYHAASAVPEEGPLPFDKPMKLWFGSGAGGWATILTLHPDGTFEGDYEDADMTIRYVCQFHGRFTDITQVSDTSWSMTLEELVLDTKYPAGREWDEDGCHYISSEPYGFDGKDGKALKPGAEFTFYTPQATGYAPGDDLYGMMDEENAPLREFWSWWPAKHGWGPNGDILGCYALHNVTSGRGFFDLYAWGLL
jgi:beta-lactamase regulating signal transducer with metallopeptidase domain